MSVEGRLRFGAQLRETLARITEDAARLLGVEGAGLRLVEGDELVRVAIIGPEGAVMTRERIRIGESLSGRVAAAGQPLIIEGPEGDPTGDPVYRVVADRYGFQSWLGVPLRERERVIGVLVMQSRTPRRFGPGEVWLLEAFAGQAAVAIENARLFEEERERRRQLEAVREVTVRMAGATDVASLLGLISRLVSELLGVESTAVYLLDEAAGVLVPRAWHGFGEWLGELRIRPGDGVAGRVAQERAGMIVNDYQDAPFAHPAVRERAAARAVIGEPLLYEGELRGVITAGTREYDRAFGEQDRELLGLFAAQAVVAIEHARLHEGRDRALAEAEAARRQAALLADASERLAGSLELATTLGSIPTLVVPALADWCALDLVEPDGRIRRAGLAHADPAKAELAERLQRYPPDRDGPEGLPRVLRTGQPLLYTELTDGQIEGAAHGPEHLAILRELGPKSLIIVPLVARGQTLGTVLLARSDGRPRYRPEDLRLAEDLARRAATALDNARLFGEAREAVRMRDEFLSIAAHELKTPITTLMGFAQVLLRELASRGELDERLVTRALHAVEQQSERLSRLVVKLLDIAQIDSGKLVLERRMTDLADLVADLVASREVSASGHSMVVQRPAEGRVLAMVDPLRLEQVMTNLLDNAIKYSPAGGRVEVTVKTKDDGPWTADRDEQSSVVHRPPSAVISVRDHGIGIPPEMRGRIFDRFYQAHAGNHMSGMGLGLYISRQIVELHGGSIRAEFPPDGGSRFILALPIGRGDSVAAGIAEATA